MGQEGSAGFMEHVRGVMPVGDGMHRGCACWEECMGVCHSV